MAVRGEAAANGQGSGYAGPERRKSGVLDDVRVAVREALDEARTLGPIEHRDHHNWIENQIQRERKRSEMWEGIRSKVIGWAIIGALGAVGTAVYKVFVRGT